MLAFDINFLHSKSESDGSLFGKKRIGAVGAKSSQKNVENFFCMLAFSVKANIFIITTTNSKQKANRNKRRIEIYNPLLLVPSQLSLSVNLVLQVLGSLSS